MLDVVTRKSILIVDDDFSLTCLLEDMLSSEGFAITVCNTALEGLKFATHNEDVDMVLLDVMLPDMNGFHWLEAFRKNNSKPVVMVTAKNQVVDRVKGLELGADDFVCKPFEAEELVARINAVLRRTRQDKFAEASPTLANGPIRVHTQHITTYIAGKDGLLTQTETRILIELIKHIDRTVSKQILNECVFNKPLCAHDRSLDMHVSNIRKKLASHGLPECLRTIRGKGYMMTGLS
jgi:two-component system response regulator CpxR